MKTSNKTSQSSPIKNPFTKTIPAVIALLKKSNLERYASFWLAGIMLAALFIAGLIYSTHEEDKTFMTQNGTWNVATNLINGNGYSACDKNYFPFCNSTNQVTAMREPMPVLFMAASMLVYYDEDSGLIMQSILYLLTALSIYFGLKKTNIQLALLAAFLWVASVPVVIEMGDDTGHMAAAFFFANGMFLFLRGIKEEKLTPFIFAGILFGISALSRTVELGIAMGLGVVLLALQIKARNKKQMINAVVFLAVLGLTFSPWVIRNKIALGSPIIGSTLTGYNLYRMNYLLAEEPFRPHYVGAKEGLLVIQQLLESNASSVLTGTENEAQMDDFYMAEGKKLILAHPLRFIQLSMYRFLILWFNIGFHVAYGRNFLIRDYIAVVQQVLFLFAIIIGSIKARKEYWPLTLSFVLGCGAYMTIGAAQLRYVVDLMPNIVILAAAAVIFPWRQKDTAG